MKVSTSILSCNNRLEAVNKLNNTSNDYLHIDVMDGKFVSNKQFTISEINNLSNISNTKADIHLMVNNPKKYIKKINSSNVEYITFHLEVKKNIDKIINLVKKKGHKVGLSIKPNTDIELLKPYIDKIDMVLVMSVEPGQGGQKFIDSTIERIKAINKMIKDKDIIIEVDGGINDSNIEKLKEENVDIVVVGSFITNNENYEEQIKKIK